MSRHSHDQAGKDAQLRGARELVLRRPDPCLLAGRQSPEIALYLSLNCPRCGQLAGLDKLYDRQSCLAEARSPCHYALGGEHHDFKQ